MKPDVECKAQQENEIYLILCCPCLSTEFIPTTRSSQAARTVPDVTNDSSAGKDKTTQSPTMMTTEGKVPALTETHHGFATGNSWKSTGRRPPGTHRKLVDSHVVYSFLAVSVLKLCDMSTVFRKLFMEESHKVQ